MVLDVNILNNLSFPDGSDSKESTCNAGDPSAIPGSGRFPGQGNTLNIQVVSASYLGH